jgi:hypothetical protein
MANEEPVPHQPGRRLPLRARIRPPVGRLVWALAAWSLSSMLMVPNAVAMCAAPGPTEQAQEGRWVNVNPKSGSLRRIAIDFVCNDFGIGPEFKAWAGYSVHPLGVCEDAECDWGWSRTESLPGGWLYSAYKGSEATRYLFVRISPYGARQLLVYVWTDFLDGRRQDYGSWDWFKRGSQFKRGTPWVPSGEMATQKKSLKRNSDLEVHAPEKPPPLVLAAVSEQLTSRPATALPPFPEDPAPPHGVCTRDCRCKDPMYLRLSNGSSADFDSANVDGIEFGPVRAQAMTEYERVKPGACVYLQGKGYVRTSQGRFDLPYFNPRGQTPLVGEYYTRAMTFDANSRSVNSWLESDAPPPDPFDAESAREQMESIARAAASMCKEFATTRRAGEVSVVIESSGRVVSVTHLNQDVAGTAVGRCITQGFQMVHVPPFTGKPQTLRGSFLISP